ncbi:MAG TPA: ABC transporter substrate-binding protein [Thermoplasmata archaeon]|nr:ABC transporter substrate-binding protein [Thermoplasmata archaeon]
MGNRVTSGTRALAVFLIAVMAVSAIPNIGSDEPLIEEAAAEGEEYVQVGWLSDFKNWNPLLVEMVSDWVAYNLVFSTLFQYDEDWNVIENHLAMDYYQVNWPAGNMSTFINITENAYFRNAENPTDTTHPLTAFDVEYTFEMIMANPGNAWDYYLYNVSGVNVTDNGARWDASRTDSPYQVRIDTEYTKATLIDDLIWVPIVPEYQWSEIKGGGILGRMDPDFLIGSGPFYVGEYDKGTWYDFVKAPNYHAEADYDEERDIDFAGIRYRVYTNIDTIALEINAGAVDVVDVTGASESAWTKIADDTADVSITKQVTTELGIYDIAINAIPPEIRDALNYADDGDYKLLDPVVRQAIGMTLDRQTIIDTYFMGLPEAADSVLSQGFWHADLENPLPYDPAAAKQLLLDNGYAPDPDDSNYLVTTANCMPVQMYPDEVEVGERLTFDVHVPDSDPGYGYVGSAWVSMAKQAGIEFLYDALSEGIMTNDEWYNCNYDLWVWSWYWGPEPLSNLACWLTDQVRVGGYNCVGPICPGGLDEPDGWWWADEDEGVARCEFDEKFDQALKTTDKDERKVLVDWLQQAIYDTYTEFPPLHPNGLYAFTNARFTGWGNWEQHVARSIISDMLWLWYDLEPTGSGSAPAFDSPPQPIYEPEVGEEVTFVISVKDADGDEITVNWSITDADSVEVAALIQYADGDTTIPQTKEWQQTFDTVGTYTLRVGLKDDNHDYETVKLSTINVVSEANLGPEIESMTWQPYRVYVGEEATWSAEAMDHEQGPDGEGLLFTWDWDDGASTTTPYKPVANDTLVTDEQTHVWDAPGTYEVELSVWDGYDVETNQYHNVSATISEFEVFGNTEPVIIMVSDISGLQGQAVTCEAIASDQDPDVLKFTWDWGDGTYSVTEHDTAMDRAAEVASTTTHTWDSAGTYDVIVWVDDGEGNNVSSDAVSATILAPGSDAPPGSITIWQSPSPGAVDVPVILMVGASDANENELTITLDFGDDEDDETLETTGDTTEMQYAEFSHTYVEEGTYIVTAHVYDGTTNVSATRDVLIVANEPPSFTLADTYTFYYNQSKTVKPVSIYDPDGDPLSVWYDWGDDTAMTEGVPDSDFGAPHTYTQIGEFVLTVYVDDGRGNNVSETADVSVQDANRKPTIVGLIGKSAPAGDAYAPGEMIYFNVTIADKEGDNVTVTMTFGDGSDPQVIQRDLSPQTNTTVTFSHAYEAGSITPYEAVVVVKDDKDHSDMTWSSLSTEVTVTKTKDGISSMLLLGIGLGLVLAVAAVALLLRHRKDKGDSSAAGMDEMEGMAPPEVEEPAAPPE